jgi:poly(A) polymerase
MEGSTPTVVKRKIEAAPWLSSAPLRRVFAALGDNSHETRVIGGAVRNTLLGQAVSDIDLATSLSPETVIERVTKAGLRVYPTGLDHGTVTVVADGASFEVTTLRRDVETDGRRAVVAFTTDWHEDALRRDFTINALSCDADGTIYDSVGGLEDLDAHRVRFIGKAEDRIREDYLRILRFFRFTAAYGAGEPDARGLAACLALKDGLTRLSAERVGSEIAKFVVTPRAGEIAGIMNSGGLFEIITGQAAHPDHLHNLQAIERELGEPPDMASRLAALCAETPAQARAVALRLRLSNSETNDLAAAADVNINALNGASEEQLKAELYTRGEAAFNRVLRVAWARSGALPSDPAWKEKSLLAARWSPPRMPFSGADVLALGIPAGPRIGRTLRAFEAWWIEAGFPVDASAQKNRLAALAAQS